MLSAFLALSAGVFAESSPRSLVIWDPHAFSTPPYGEMILFLRKNPQDIYTFVPPLPGLDKSELDAATALKVLENPDFSVGGLTQDLFLKKKDVEKWVGSTAPRFDKALLLVHGSPGRLWGMVELPFSKSNIEDFAQELLESSAKFPDLKKTCRNEAQAFVSAQQESKKFRETEKPVTNPPNERLEKFLQREATLEAATGKRLSDYQATPSDETLRLFCETAERSRRETHRRIAFAVQNMRQGKDLSSADEKRCSLEADRIRSLYSFQSCLLDFYDKEFNLSRSGLLKVLKPQAKAAFLSCEFGNQGVPSDLVYDLDKLHRSCPSQHRILSRDLHDVNREHVASSLRSLCSDAPDGAVFSAAEINSLASGSALDRVSVEAGKPNSAVVDVRASTERSCWAKGLAGKLTHEYVSAQYFHQKNSPLSREEIKGFACRDSATLSAHELDEIARTLGHLALLNSQRLWVAVKDIYAPAGFAPFESKKDLRRSLDKEHAFNRSLLENFGPGRLAAGDVRTALEIISKLDEDLKVPLSSVKCYQCVSNQPVGVGCGTKVGSSSFDDDFSALIKNIPSKPLISLRDGRKGSRQLQKASRKIMKWVGANLPGIDLKAVSSQKECFPSKAESSSQKH